MNISIFLIFRIFGVVSKWAEKALEDGKITITETVDLATELAQILGVPLHIDIPTSSPEKDEQDHIGVDYTEPRPHKPEA
jgi:hypothetical protein